MTESRGILAIACCWISRSGFVQWSAVLLSFADGLPSDASCRSASEAVAHDIAAAAKGGLLMASVPSLMERLRSSTSLIGCLQASMRRRQAQGVLFSSQVIPSGGSSVIAALISLCHSLDIPVRMYARGVLAELSVLMGTSCGRGEKGAATQSRRHPGLAGRRPLHFFRKCWRVAVSAYAGRLFASSARFCNQDSERGSGKQDICKTEERSVCTCRCCQ